MTPSQLWLLCAPLSLSFHGLVLEIKLLFFHLTLNFGISMP